MWEAWWQGDPYLNVERLYRDTVFGARSNDDAGYDRALDQVLAAAGAAPYVIVQAGGKTPTASSAASARTGPQVEIVAPDDDEVYIIGKA